LLIRETRFIHLGRRLTVGPRRDGRFQFVFNLPACTLADERRLRDSLQAEVQEQSHFTLLRNGQRNFKLTIDFLYELPDLSSRHEQQWTRPELRRDVDIVSSTFLHQ
jgi:hypothetical protein